MLTLENVKIEKVGAMETVGNLGQHHKVEVVFSKTNKNWRGEEFSDTIMMPLWNERIATLNPQEGELLEKVLYTADVKEYNGRLYNNFRILDITRSHSAAIPTPPFSNDNSPIMQNNSNRGALPTNAERLDGIKVTFDENTQSPISDGLPF